ncbi:MAG TPA: SpoIIE family protein phosphatase [Anaerolineales bacterium]|nr:SpoIIE family protein phosphatase [Anaerolineales bacterium]
MAARLETLSVARQHRTLRRLEEISFKLLSQLELNPLLQSIAREVVEVLSADSGGIYRYDAQRKELRPVIPVKQPKDALYAVKPGEGMAGRVMVTGKAMKVDNYDLWSGRTPKQRKGTVGPVVQAPVRKGKEFLGVIYAERNLSKPVFTDEDLESIQLFANYAAIAITNAQLYEEAKRAASEFTSLYQTSLEITQQLELDKVLEGIIRRAEALVNGKNGQFYSFDEERQVLIPGSPGHLPRALQRVSMKPGEGMSGTVFATRKPLIVPDYDKWEGRASSTPKGYIGQAIGIPVEHGDRILGVIAISRSKTSAPFNEHDVRLLTLFAGQAAVALTNARQYDELQKLYGEVRVKERLESELTMAHTIQASLLPQKLPRIHGWDLAACWVAAREISGDFYDCFAVPGGRWGFVIADVAGKGVPAALFMALCRTLTRTFCMDGRPPREAIARVNDLIIADSYSDWFITLFYGVLDPKWGILTYVNAGHPRPLWLKNKGKKLERLAADGIALGVFEGITLEEKSVQLEPGDSVLMYTDGISEALDSSGTLYGERRIQAVLRRSAQETPTAVLENLQKDVADFSKGISQADDLTAIMLKRKLGK